MLDLLYSINACIVILTGATRNSKGSRANIFNQNEGSMRDVLKRNLRAPWTLKSVGTIRGPQHGQD